jgi:hypothetical protein
MIDLNNPDTFKLSESTHKRHNSKVFCIANSAVRSDTDTSVLAAIHNNRECYDGMTVDGTPILEIIKKL